MPLAMTVSEFCTLHHIPRSTFYKLRPELRPRAFRVGRRVLISVESARDWRALMEGKTAGAASA